MAADLTLVKSKVQQYLTETGAPVTIDSDGDYSIRVESARVFVRVLPHPNGEATLVNVFSQVLNGVPATPDFYKFVATNDAMIFGTLLAADRPDGTCSLILRHMLLGDYLDKDELIYAVFGIVGSANSMDDELASRFGGVVFHKA